MGRPRVHDEHTATILLAAAEQLLQEGGTTALSMRGIADRAGTSTRAVYSVFGPKEALLGALGAHAMYLLGERVDAIPVTADPRFDLVETALVFRSFALDHPALFEVAFWHVDQNIRPLFRASAADALTSLTRRFQAFSAAGMLGRRSMQEAELAFDCLCRGMASAELRRFPPGIDPERLWRDAFWAQLT